MRGRDDMSGARTLTAGSFLVMEPGHRYFVHTITETVLQVHGMGPLVLNYLNPADDPRRR